MRRLIAVITIAALLPLAPGFDRLAWADQDASAKEREAQRARVVRSLERLRPGSTVLIEQRDRSKVHAVVQEIGPDSIRVLAEDVDPGKTARTSTGVLAQTIPIDDIRNIRPTRVGRGNPGEGHFIAVIAATVIVLTTLVVMKLKS